MKRTLSLNLIEQLLPEARIVGRGGDFRISRFVTDSRTPLAGGDTLFAALRTEVNDGHRYIGDMYDRGVRVFLVETLPAEVQRFAEAVFIVVPDVYAAIGTLAAELSRQGGRTVLVTGSTAKTEVKETLYSGLRKAGVNVFRSPRSFNSYLGVCLSVFENWVEGGSEVQIYEAGIDGPGQAEAINAILRPQIGIISDLTDEHDEQFPDHAAKVREKLALLKGAEKVYFHVEEGSDRDIILSSFPDAVAVEEQGSAALAKAVRPGCDFADIEPGSLRTAILGGVRGNILMLDSFSADMASLHRGLERFLRHSAPGRELVAVLGRVDGFEPEQLSKYGLKKVIDLSRGEAACGDSAAETLNNSDIYVFGESTAALDAFVNAVERADHDTTLTVDLDALVHNFNAYRHMVPAGTGMVAMVKASAYGLGSIEVAKALQSAGAAVLAVAVVDEGVDMRSAGITMPIMVMNPMTRHYDALFANRLQPAVFSMEELERLVDEANRLGITDYPVHIKLDTGMHRVGFTASQLPGLIDALKAQTAVRVESVFTHLATADCLDKDDYTLGQIRCFASLCETLSSGLGHAFKRHILNTAGMMRFADSCSYEMARLGIGLYGISPLPGKDLRLQPVASLTSVVISLRRWPAGTPIGYGNKGVTARDSLVATVPIGYADGIDRHLGNGATSFIVNGTECPTIGNICMDMCMVDVTDAPGVEIGTAVEIFGRTKAVEQVAEVLGTIPYEVLTSVSPRVQRCYITG